MYWLNVKGLQDLFTEMQQKDLPLKIIVKKPSTLRLNSREIMPQFKTFKGPDSEYSKIE